ncbi:hypothetical protein [Demequina soli]|uniref:hypothetical protein n=1 Tax=Demequina soli TaxID=1638987 RepID=UPI0007859ABA|nr:hypothetical protein [Demequina soli]
MAEQKKPAQPPEGSSGNPNLKLLGYLGLILGFGAVALTVDSGSVTVLGFSFPVAVPIIAAIAFVGGLLAGRFPPRKGDL